MKSLCLGWIAALTWSAAADAPKEFAFESTTIGLPALQLSSPTKNSPLIAPARSADIQKYFPASGTDLIAPAATRERIIQTFQQSQRAPTLGAHEPQTRRGPSIVYPFASTDLIGSNASRARVIEDFKARTQSK
jgi:hypothetical protein